MSRPLWRVLLDMQRPEPAPLTEAECVALLELLAEEMAAGYDPKALQPLIDRCLAEVPRDRLPSVFVELLDRRGGRKG